MKYEVNYPPLHGDEWITIEAVEAQEAAREYGKRYREAGLFLNDPTIFTKVREKGSDAFNIYMVCIEVGTTDEYVVIELCRTHCKECEMNLTYIVGPIYEGHFCCSECSDAFWWRETKHFEGWYSRGLY